MVKIINADVRIQVASSDWIASYCRPPAAVDEISEKSVVEFDCFMLSENIVREVRIYYRETKLSVWCNQKHKMSWMGHFTEAFLIPQALNSGFCSMKRPGWDS